MLKDYYLFLITAKMRNLDFFEYLNIAEEYGKIKTRNDFSAETKLEEDVPVFYKASEEQYFVYYKNLAFSFTYDEKTDDKIVRIQMKRPDDCWTFNLDDDGHYDLSSPVNVHAEVYIHYSVSVLRVNRCSGENYKSGTWNKTFYRNLCSFLEAVRGYQEISILKKAYEK